ncbi:uncharacterized protein ACO6RY_03785 [Pungitius sinensis]
MTANLNLLSQQEVDSEHEAEVSVQTGTFMTYCFAGSPSCPTGSVEHWAATACLSVRDQMLLYFSVV